MIVLYNSTFTYLLTYLLTHILAMLVETAVKVFKVRSQRSRT